MILAFSVLTSLAPLWLTLALAVDLVRKLGSRLPLVTTRLVLFGMFYTAAELVGLLALSWVWVSTRDHDVRLERTYRVQSGWAYALYRSALFLFDLRVEVRGSECARPGPVIVLMRHASILDTLLPTVLIARAHDLRLRFVLKRELLNLPCLDVAGNRLPNCFVGRDGEDSEREIAKVRALSEGLSSRDGLLIYPEGTRFSRPKLERARSRLELSDPARFARYRDVTSVLPIKKGGVLTMLEQAATADLVIAAHRGLTGFAELGDLWRGGFVGARAEVRMWRIPRAAIPDGAEERLAFLDREWQKVEQFAAGGSAPDEPRGLA